MTHWLYLPQLESTGDTAVLEDSEAVHAVRARRLRVGDSVSVFDGVGRTAVARISDVIKRPLEVHLAVGAHQHWVPPAVRIHLTSALPKGDRQVTMLDMATQLGITDFTPVNFERSVSRTRTNSQDRWRRVLIESCKQSQRPWLPLIHSPVDLDHWISHPTDGGVVSLIAHKQGESCNDIIKESLSGAKHIRLLVGPEGGFSENELTRLDHTQAIMVSLGEGVLRVEAAAVALTALVGRLPVAGRIRSQPAPDSV